MVEEDTTLDVVLVGLTAPCRVEEGEEDEGDEGEDAEDKEDEEDEEDEEAEDDKKERGGINAGAGG